MNSVSVNLHDYYSKLVNLHNYTLMDVNDLIIKSRRIKNLV